MRKIYDSDVKNRITTVTEFSLTRKGVKKETYATEYTNTNLIELDPIVQSTMVNAIGKPITAIASSMLSSEIMANIKPIICTADTVTSDFIITEPTLLEYATVTVQNKYSENTVITIWIHSDEDPIVLGSITLDNPDSDGTYTISLNHGIDASSENPVVIRASIINNTLDGSSAVLMYRYAHPSE